MDKVTNVAEHVFTVQTQNEDLEFKERHSYIESFHSTFENFSTGTE